MELDVERVSKHFFELRGETPFHIIDVHGFMGGMIDATTALQKGGLVMMMADRLYKGRSEEVEFLGHKVRFPVAAYHLACNSRLAGCHSPLSKNRSKKLYHGPLGHFISRRKQEKTGMKSCEAVPIVFLPPLRDM